MRWSCLLLDMKKEKIVETQVLIIGGGATGAGVMRDLALRNVNCLLIDKKDLCGGASGGNHGLLHSGGRYVSNDQEAARECREESEILKKLAPHCIEKTGSLFVAADEDDDTFIANFPSWCKEAGIASEPLAVDEARAMEPHLAEKLKQVFLLPDATVDPFRLVLDNVAEAMALGNAEFRAHLELVSFEYGDGRISAAVCLDTRSGEMVTIRADQYVNASGAWAMDVARKAGCDEVNLLYSKGTLLVTNDRICNKVIHRLRPPGDGDILVPGGTVSVLGTTSVRVDRLENLAPTAEEVDCNIREAAAMVPHLEQARYIRAFAGVRPLIQSLPGADDRSMTRGFALFGHERQLENLATITGGKLTTYRLMAEKTTDLVAGRLGIEEKCKTGEVPLIDSKACRWTAPGASPKYWYRKKDPEDTILCECEMVPKSAIDEIIEDAPGKEDVMTLEAIALRSRAGKGPCQGSFCSLRLAAYLYDVGYYRDETGLLHMKDFLNERFKGLRSIMWGQQMAQMELAEALHCGLVGLDLIEKPGQEE